LSINNSYTSNAVLIPTSAKDSNLTANSLASLAGINVGNTTRDFNVAIAFINSKKIIRQLMKHESFLPDLMAAKKWDTNNESMIYHDDIYDYKNKKWIRDVSLPRQKIPSEQEAFKLFSKKINVSLDKKKKIITLSVEHISPKVAKQWAQWIIDEANLMVASLAIEEAENSIDYLRNQINQTPYAELRTMFFELIQQNTQNMMLAKVNKQYALTIIDPPLIPETKSKPMRSMIVIFGTLFGGILSIIIVLLRKYGFNKDDELDIFKLR
jgi:capsule polysaccharide export protein KpsE/RkpR